MASEMVWLQQLLKHFDVSINTTMVVCDNKFVIHLPFKPSHNQRSKHIDNDCHFILEFVKKNSALSFMSTPNIK